MLIRKFIILILMFFTVLLLTGAVSATSGLADSPQPKYHHDNNNTGRTSYVGSATNTTKWTYTTGNAVQSSPAIGKDGTIYFGSNNKYFYALNPNGTLKWKYATAGIVRSSPAIGNDGTIYFGCYDKYFYALNPNGTLKWKYTTGGITDSSNPAIGSDGTIYFGCEDNYFYALTSKGALKWKYSTGNAVQSSPAISSSGIIYFGSNDGYLYALNPNGTLKWKYTTNCTFVHSPAIGKDGTIYFGADVISSGLYFAVNQDGTKKWQYPNYGTCCDPAIASDGTIYIVSTPGSRSYQYITALNSDGTKKWTYFDKLNIEWYTSSPIIDGKGTIYIGGYNYSGTYGYLLTINSNGTLKWRYKNTNTKYIFTPTISSDGTIYFGSEKLYAIKQDTTPPQITNTNPSNGAANIAASKTITITFNEAIKKGSKFLVGLKNSNGTSIAFNSMISGKVLIIDPKNNLAESLYTLIIPYSSVTDLTGNPAAAKTIKFSVGTPPKVTSTTPTNLKTGVSRTGTIVIKFSENIYTSTYYNKIILKNLSTGKTTTITKAISGNTLYIKNTTIRSANTWYQIIIPVAAVKDKAGNIQTTAYTFKFRTGTK